MLIPNIQERIFYHYYPNCVLNGKAISSPFRKDNHPSFSIKLLRKWYIWKDWSTGESGNCFDFVAKYHGLNTKTNFNLILNKICTDLGYQYLLNNNSDVIKQLVNLNENMKQNILDIYDKLECDDKVNIKFKKKLFNQDEIQYWKSQGLLNESSLKYLHIYSVSEAHMVINKYVKTIYNYSSYKSINRDENVKKLFYCFAYNYDNKYLKLYRPYHFDKWKSTVPAKMVCLKTIFNNDTLIITKAKKEQLHLFDIQSHMIDKYDILPLNNETSFIEWYYHKIKHNYKRIILWLDNDNAGQKSMNKWKNMYDLEIFYTNKFKNITDMYSHEYQINKINALKQSLCLTKNLVTNY